MDKCSPNLSDSAWELFQQGMARAEAQFAAETRNYERLRFGVAALLEARGLAPVEGEPNLAAELHGRFFAILSCFPLPESLGALQKLVGYLDDGLQRWSVEPPASFQVREVLSGELRGPFSPYYLDSISNRVSEVGRLKEKIGAMQKEMRAPALLDSLPDGGPLFRLLHTTVTLAGHFNRCCDLVWALSDALTPGGDERRGMAALRALARTYIAAADALEARALATIADAEARLKAIPVETANGLLAFSGLPGKVRKAYRNGAGDGRYASNGAWMADLEAAPDDKARETLALCSEARPNMQAAIAKLWPTYLASVKPAELLGVTPVTQYAVLATEGNALFAVDGELLAWLWRSLWPDALAVGTAVVALIKNGRPVAALALERKLEPDEMDADAARRRAATLLPLERPAPKKKAARTAAQPRTPASLFQEEAA